MQRIAATLHLHDVAHVQFIESCQHGVGVLSLLQPAGDLLPHPVHLDPVLGPGARDGGGRVRGRQLHHGRRTRSWPGWQRCWRRHGLKYII